MSVINSIFSPFKNKSFGDVVSLTESVTADFDNLSQISRHKFISKIVTYFDSQACTGKAVGESDWKRFDSAFSLFLKKENDHHLHPNSQSDSVKLVHEIQKLTKQNLCNVPHELKPIVFIGPSQEKAKREPGKQAEVCKGLDEDDDVAGGKEEVACAKRDKRREVVLPRKWLEREGQSLLALVSQDGRLDLGELQTTSAFNTIVEYFKAQHNSHFVLLRAEYEDFSDLYRFAKRHKLTEVIWCLQQFVSARNSEFSGKPANEWPEKYKKLLDAFLEEEFEHCPPISELRLKCLCHRLDSMNAKEIGSFIKKTNTAPTVLSTGSSSNTAIPKRSVDSDAIINWGIGKMKNMKTGRELDEFFDSTLRVPLVVERIDEPVSEEYLVIPDFVDRFKIYKPLIEAYVHKRSALAQVIVSNRDEHLYIASQDVERLKEFTTICREIRIGELVPKIRFSMCIPGKAKADEEFFKEFFYDFINEVLFKRSEVDYDFLPKTIEIAIEVKTCHGLDADTFADKAIKSLIEGRENLKAISAIKIEIVTSLSLSLDDDEEPAAPVPVDEPAPAPVPDADDHLLFELH
jgi:hypothetical protein